MESNTLNVSNKIYRKILFGLGIKFKYYDPNPYTDKLGTNDCAVRALSKFMNVSWKEAYDRLYKTAVDKTGQMINAVGNISTCLDENECKYKRYRAPNTILLDWLSENTDKECMLCNKDHIVYVKNGTIYDRRHSMDAKEQRTTWRTWQGVFRHLTTPGPVQIFVKEK